MANRHLSRSIALQSLFEIDFNNQEGTKVPSEVIDRNASEFAPGLLDRSFIENLVAGVFEKKGDIDQIIVKAAPDWPLSKISPIDRTVLRIGLYELLFGDRKQVPPKVAINEAIELAKNFGGEKSGKFVNGVLGSVYRQIGEPGKDEVSKRKTKDIPLDQLPIKRLAGAVIYAKEGENVYLALVHDVFGYWTLSKGGLEPGESETEGVVKKIKEEINIDIEVKEELGRNEYVASQPEEGKIRKQVVYFLAEAPFQDLQLQKTGGLDDARWFKLADVVSLNMYDDILPIVTNAINILLRKK